MKIQLCYKESLVKNNQQYSLINDYLRSITTIYYVKVIIFLLSVNNRRFLFLNFCILGYTNARYAMIYTSILLCIFEIDDFLKKKKFFDNKTSNVLTRVWEDLWSRIISYFLNEKRVLNVLIFRGWRHDAWSEKRNILFIFLTFELKT